MPIQINDLTEWQILQLHRADIVTGADTHQFEELEKSSKFEFKPINVETDTGGLRTVAYEIQFRLVIAQNNFKDLAETFLDLSFPDQVIDIIFHLGGTKAMTISAGSDTSQTNNGFNHFNLQINVASVDESGLSLIIEGNAILNIYIFNKTNPFIFNQLWSNSDE